MKIAGISRKDGITLQGSRYQVRMTYTDQSYTLDLKSIHGAKAGSRLSKIPGLRGTFSLFRTSPVLLIGLGLQLISEWVDEDSKLYHGIMVADTAITAALLWKIASDVGAVRRFHGAEHKVINACEEGIEMNVQEVRKVSRIARRCGTNFIGFYLLAQLMMQLLPVRSQTVKTVLAMSLAYEGFRLDPERYGIFLQPFYTLGEALQRFFTTAEPGDSELRAAVEAMKMLMEAENKRSDYGAGI